MTQPQAKHEQTRPTQVAQAMDYANSPMISTKMDSQESKQPLFDSLPYYDNEYADPVLAAKVAKELNWRPDPSQPLHPNVPPEVDLFSKNSFLKAELARVEAAGGVPSKIDTQRHQMPTPETATDDAWKDAINNAISQGEHMRLRHTNLSLLQTYGSNAWLMQNHDLQAEAERSEKALKELNESTTELNRSRRTFQTRVGEQLNILETRWTELVSNILQIEMANAALENELVQMKHAEAQYAEQM